QRKDAKGQVLQLDLHTGPVQFARFQVELKYTESNSIGERSRRFHRSSGKARLPHKKRPTKDIAKGRLGETVMSLRNKQLSWIWEIQDRSIWNLRRYGPKCALR